MNCLIRNIEFVSVKETKENELIDSRKRRGGEREVKFLLDRVIYDQRHKDVSKKEHIPREYTR